MGIVQVFSSPSSGQLIGFIVKAYGRRWHQESLHSVLKRTMGSTLLARTERGMFHEALLKVLAYAVKR